MDEDATTGCPKSTECRSIRTVDQLEEALSTPTAGVIETLGRLDGDILILGVGGKMGPTLARMARRGSDAAGARRRVIGVSRFSDAGLEARLNAHGIETIRCNLLEEAKLNALPKAPNVIHMAGMKFGATEDASLTWAMNCYLPARVCQRFGQSRIVAFSTGNVYGLVSAESGGSLESDSLNPDGDYAMSCLGRERMFEHFSGTVPVLVSILRLNYACELRYGVLVDLAQQVWAQQPINLSMGQVNVIWQGDANAMTLAAFDRVASPPFVLNIAGPEMLSVRQVCRQFGDLMGRTVRFTGTEAPEALLSNGKRGHQIFGCPRVNVAQLIRWIADWVQAGGPTLDKPTRFEVRDGRF